MQYYILNNIIYIYTYILRTCIHQFLCTCTYVNVYMPASDSSAPEREREREREIHRPQRHAYITYMVLSYLCMLCSCCDARAGADQVKFVRKKIKKKKNTPLGFISDILTPRADEKREYGCLCMCVCIYVCMNECFMCSHDQMMNVMVSYVCMYVCTCIYAYAFCCRVYVARTSHRVIRHENDHFSHMSFCVSTVRAYVYRYLDFILVLQQLKQSERKCVCVCMYVCMYRFW
jgi:hypothetical protein